MSHKLTDSIFIQKANEIHQVYNYDKVIYINAHTDVTIICPIHGEFQQRPYAHISLKQGCPKCGLLKRKHPDQKTNEQFIKQCDEKWGDKYDYSLTEYINKTTKITFICPKHGKIEQLPTLHLRTGCQYCNGRGISKHSLNSFVEIANKVHGNKYDYSKINFLRMTDNIEIICPIHGLFTQRAGNHIHLRNGCPQCVGLLTKSSPEKEIADFIKEIYKGKVEDNVKILNGQEIDIYLPDLKLGIEYHGIYWHLETTRGRKYHYEKWRRANALGIRLIQIYENEWRDKKEILKSRIKSLLGFNSRIFARKTKIVNLDKHTLAEFLDSNHLQGSDSSKIGYGLEHEGKLVAVMSFGPSRFNKNYNWELLRFANISGVNVVGGASKLLNYFKKNNSGSIISYADKRYSDGNLYFKLGFTLETETQPSFSYVKISNTQIFSRMKFQKKNIIKMKGYSPDLTEYEIMQLNGYDRIWDAGQYRFVME